MEFDVRVFEDLDELSLAAAGEIAGVIERAVSSEGRFSIALSGGRTPRLIYELLASEFGDIIPWDSVHMFWGDERYVPGDHPDSNYAMARESLISRVPLPTENINRIPTEIEPPEAAARAYENTLRGFFRSREGEETDRTFDLILQGVGEDGHTASLFPGDPAVRESDRWVLPVLAPPAYSPRQRITLTLPVLNSARKAFFLVSGAGKREVLKSALDVQSSSDHPFPAARIHPRESVVWYADRASYGG